MAPMYLVTGGAGFIGSHLASSLLADGADVVVADDLSTGKRRNVPDGAAFIEADLSRQSGIAQLPDRRYDAVLHLAGQASGEQSFLDPVRDFDGNARSTLLLARWALERGIPAFLHASSMGVYGNTDAAVPENAPTIPVSFYGASKLAAERILAVAAREGIRACSIRMFNVYGAGQDLANLTQGMVSIYLAFVLNREPVVVRGSLNRVRDLVHVDDVVGAWKAALHADVSGPLNVGTGIGTRVEELLAALFDTCGVAADYPIRLESSTPGDVEYSVADIERARRELAWAPHVPLVEGLRRFVRGAELRSAV